MRKHLFLLPLVALFLLASCNGVSDSSNDSQSSIETGGETSSSLDEETSSSVEDSSSSSSSDSASSSLDDSSSEVEGTKQKYFYQPNQNDFNGSGYDTTAGTTDLINGLSWDYDDFSFLGQSSDGIQIGSNKQPQRTPWTLKTSFPGTVYLLSYEVALKTNSGVHLEVNSSDYNYLEDVPGNGVVTSYGETGLDIPVENFSISLSTQSKAIYLYSLSLELFVPNGVDLDLDDGEDELIPAEPGVGDVPPINYELITVDEYYREIDFTSSDEIVWNDLSSLVSDMTKISYGEDTYIMLYTDESVEKPGTLYGLYDGDEIIGAADGSWNKEHVWACSQMKLDGKDPRPDGSTKNHATDLHNLRVTCQNSNGAHGNKFYDNSDSEIAFYPNIPSNGGSNHAFSGDHRGDVARILFYMALRYDFLKLTDDIEHADDLSMGRLSVLLTWSQEDPVDDFERQRNDRIYEYQKNRNPFIDFPELVERFY